jgi:putative membrane protein
LRNAAPETKTRSDASFLKEAFMKTVRVIEVLSVLGPLAFVACEKNESSRPSETPSNSAEYAPGTSAATADERDKSSMTPASGVADPERQPMAPPEGEGAAPAAGPAPALGDEQIVAITDAAHTAEIDAAKLALSKSKNARVKKFAQMMIDHHGKAKKDGAKLVTKLGLTPGESAKLNELKTDSADGKKTLDSAPADMIDKVYIDLQIADHKMVLDALDRELIPAAKNPELKRSLEEFRPKVEAHLREAEEIQAMLTKSPAQPNKSGTSSSPSTPSNVK